ncbi:MAG: ABC transporter ATP-binding protein/permease [Gammaproteobacteria bacterium]|nr:ABC transporter ATP-binding protein/permease [Gammaproteobacteria bacterium]
MLDRWMIRLSKILLGDTGGKWIAPVLRKYFHALLLVLGLSIFSALLGLAPPYLTKLLIDDGLMAKDGDSLILWAACLFAVGLFAVIFGAVNSLVHLRFSARMLNDIRSNTLQALMAIPPHRIARIEVGEMMTRLDGDASEVQRFTFDALLSGLGAILRLVGGAIMLMILQWQLALLAISLAPLEFLFLKWARPRTEKLAGGVRQQRGRVSSFLAESIAGLGTIKGLGAEHDRLSSLQPVQKDHLRTIIRQRRWMEVVGGIPTVMTAITRSMVLLVGGFWVIRGDWQIGSLIAFLAYMGFLVGPMRTLLGLYHAQARVKISIGRISDLFVDSPEETAVEQSCVPSSDHDIELENVSFAHGGQASLLFDGIDLRIPQGNKVLLKAPSGLGKTTLLGLLTRWYSPESGSISIGNCELSTIDEPQLRKIVCMVSQEEYFFNTTVGDNLRLADAEASEERLWSVLEIACLADDLRNAAHGLDTRIAEKGSDFSGGQRQRLAIARALLRPFRILILDESLSEIDAPTANRIVQNIDQNFAAATRILVTHHGEENLGPFDQLVEMGTSEKSGVSFLKRLGDMPYQREKARVKAV